MIQIRKIIAVVAAISFPVACTEPSGPEPLTVEPVALTEAEWPILMMYPAPLAVRVTGRNGASRAGIEVEWAVVSGGGSLDTTAVLTDSLGMAQAVWRLGPVTGEQMVEARVQDTDPMRFTVAATPGYVLVTVWQDLSEELRDSLPSDTIRIHALRPGWREYAEDALAAAVELSPRGAVVAGAGLDPSWVFHFDPVEVFLSEPSGYSIPCTTRPLLTEEDLATVGHTYCPVKLRLRGVEDVPEEYLARLAAGDNL